MGQQDYGLHSVIRARIEIIKYYAHNTDFVFSSNTSVRTKITIIRADSPIDLTYRLLMFRPQNITTKHKQILPQSISVVRLPSDVR